MGEKTHKRLFFAIPLKEELIAECLKAQNQLPPEKGIRLVNRQNLHITALFLGKVLIADLPELTKNAAEIISSSPSFSLEKREFCFMPSVRKPRMLWLMFHKKKHFTDLYQNLSKGLEGFFDCSEKLDPIPHITLARIKPGVLVKDIQDFSGILSFDVQKVELWESQTLATGAKYLKLQTFSLGTTLIEG